MREQPRERVSHEAMALLEVYASTLESQLFPGINAFITGATFDADKQCVVFELTGDDVPQADKVTCIHQHERTTAKLVPIDDLPLRTPEEWMKLDRYKGIEILDPDGWDRQDFERSWSEPIDRKTFDARLAMCTLSLDRYARTQGVFGYQNPHNTKGMNQCTI